MTFIIAPRKVVRVTIRKPNKNGQRVLAFSLELRRQMLNNVTHVAVGIEEKTKTLTFYPSGKMFQKQPAHKLARDGGSKKMANCVLFSSSAAEFIKNVPSRRYKVDVHKDRFEICWGKQ